MMILQFIKYNHAITLVKCNQLSPINSTLSFLVVRIIQLNYLYPLCFTYILFVMFELISFLCFLDKGGIEIHQFKKGSILVLSSQ